MIDDCNKCAAQLCTDDRKRIFQQLYVLCKNGSWVGDVIMAAAGDLKRTIKVYSASINSSPWRTNVGELRCSATSFHCAVNIGVTIIRHN